MTTSSPDEAERPSLRGYARRPGPGQGQGGSFEEFWRRLTGRGVGAPGGGGGGGGRPSGPSPRASANIIIAILAVAVVIWLATGTYILQPGELGVVRRFGKYVGQPTLPGINYRLPFPIDTLNVVNVAEVRRVEIGYRTTTTAGGVVSKRTVPAESLMLTRDENIVDVEILVQYQIKSAPDFVFRVENPEPVLGTATEVALRSVVGNTNIDDVLTTGRGQVENEVRSFLQRLLDDYQAGIQVTAVKLQVADPPQEVKDAFNEVVRALEDRQRLQREAEGYAADVVPKARGEAQQAIRGAEAYREQRIAQARGDASKFTSVLAEYLKAKDVTRQRLYLETIEKVLPGMEKIVIDPQASGGGLLQFLPLRDGASLPVTTPGAAGTK
ncbi:MAG: FtsH protease activity modulator HflK [Chloroflexi bacterium]|nr:FtsH protease activity modulator HflK [Chloroflexota bacterium]